MTARYGAAQILFGVDIDLDAGEVVALMGPQRRRKIDEPEGDHGPDGASHRQDDIPRRGHFVDGSL